ncbi:MAG: hypothetical protein JWQ69_5944 [Pseudomonas sp.]|nr:hypothetical protein [Pseudomonas sp.]
MKISDLIPTPSRLTTSIGDLYIRYLSAGDMSKLAKAKKEQNLEIIGNKALQLLVSRDCDDSSRDGLSDEDYAALSDADFKLIIPLAYRQCDLSPPEGTASIGSFGAAIRVILQELLDSSRKISESFASVLSPNTLSQFTTSLEGITKATDRIRQSIASRHIGERESAAVVSMPLNRIDFSALPENRAAKATEKSSETLERMSDLLLEMAGSIGSVADNLMRKVVPEYLISLDQSRVSATRTLRITVVGLVFSALVSVALTGWQVYLANKSGEESGEQAKEALATLQLQLEATRSAQDKILREFAIQRQQNEELNARLIAALKTIPAPFIQPVTTAKSKPNTP